MLLLFAGLWGYGAYRLATTPTARRAGCTLRLVQPDIPQAEKYVRALMPRNWQRLLDLSIQPPRAKSHPYHLAGSRHRLSRGPLGRRAGPDRAVDRARADA